jgi:hypothetical protein
MVYFSMKIVSSRNDEVFYGYKVKNSDEKFKCFRELKHQRLQGKESTTVIFLNIANSTCNLAAVLT